MPISDLVSAVKAGGVTVETAYENDPGHLAYRTVIQLDGDMMVYVDPRIRSDSPEWSMHERETKTRVRKMAVAAKGLTIGISVCTAGSMMFIFYLGGQMFELDTEIAIEVWGSIVGGVVLQLGLTWLFPQIVPELVGWLLKGISHRWRRLAGFEQRDEFLRRTTEQP